MGAVSNLDHYYIEHDFSVLGENATLHLLVDDISYACSAAMTEVEEETAQRITVSKYFSLINGDAVLSSSRDSLWDGPSLIQIFLLADSALCIILAVVLLLMLRKKVAVPTKALLRANHALACGDTSYRLDAGEAGSQEFRMLYDSFNEMAEQIVQLRIQAYDLQFQEEKNKLTMLRAQI